MDLPDRRMFQRHGGWCSSERRASTNRHLPTRERGGAARRREFVGERVGGRVAGVLVDGRGVGGGRCLAAAGGWERWAAAPRPAQLTPHARRLLLHQVITPVKPFFVPIPYIISLLGQAPAFHPPPSRPAPPPTPLCLAGAPARGQTLPATDPPPLERPSSRGFRVEQGFRVAQCRERESVPRPVGERARRRESARMPGERWPKWELVVAGSPRRGLAGAWRDFANACFPGGCWCWQGGRGGAVDDLRPRHTTWPGLTPPDNVIRGTWLHA